LRHGAAESPERPLDFAQVADFFPELHGRLYISDRDIYIAICDLCQDLYFLSLHGLNWFRQVEARIAFFTTNPFPMLTKMNARGGTRDLGQELAGGNRKKLNEVMACGC
jgi:hypothetical protein